MRKIKAIIIDDEVDAVESLQFELEHYCPEVEVVNTYNSSVKALEESGDWDCNVLFLDIEMPILSGFDLLEKIEAVDYTVIFVTAYDQFAIKAFEFNASNYLLKPIQKDKLITSVKRIQDHHQQHFRKEDLNATIANIRSQTNYESDNIALPTSEGFVFIRINDIIYIQAESNYSWVHSVDGQKFLLSKTLKNIEEMIVSRKFIRVHQSYCVNLAHVSKYVRGQGGYLVLNDGNQIPVSRSKKEDLMALLSTGF